MDWIVSPWNLYIEALMFQRGGIWKWGLWEIIRFHYIIWLYVLEDSAGLKWFLKTDRKVILQIMTMDWSFLKLFSFYNKTKPMKKYICLQKPQNPDQIIYTLIHLSRKKPFRVVWNSDFI